MMGKVPMAFDDEFDDDYDGAPAYDDTHSASHRVGSIPEGSDAGDGFDPMDIANPISAYFFLSDDAQDEINGSSQKKMKCCSCGHRFMGESYDSCPECYSVNTEEVVGIDEMDGSKDGFHMECMDCGHRFTGEIYDRCPECLSPDTHELSDETNDSYF